MATASGGRVLLADDDETFRQTTCALLASHGYECHAVADAHEATRLLPKAPWDALLTDVAMPGSDELAYLTRHASSQPLPSVVVVTAYPAVNTAVSALRMSAADYLTKPVELEHLLAAVARAVARTRERAHQRTIQQQLKSLATLVDDASPRSSRPPAPSPGRAAEPSESPPFRRPDLTSLSQRERDIVTALQNGYRAREIAEALSLSVRTVRNHLHSVFRKLGVSSQVELLAELRNVQEH